MTTNVIEKPKPIDNKVDETIANELFKRFHKETPSEIDKHFQRTAKDIVFDKMSVSLSTSGIEKKTIENYYNQIQNNRYVSKKGMYLVCRDLFDAKVNLSDTQYSSLLVKLDYSQSSVYKQEAIGSDFRLFKMFNQGRLPENWTTQYALTQFNDEQFKRVIDDKNINHQSTLVEIIKFRFNKFQKEIKKFMNDYKFLTIEYANGFKEKISAIVDSRETKDRKSNTITA